MRKLYLAAPLFNDSERRFNVELCATLEATSNVFLPQRDGLLMQDLLLNDVPLNTARRLVYEADIQALRECECLIAVLDGRTIDEGVAFEIGYARALNKHCFGLKTDTRSLLKSGDNPMIECGCDAIVGTIVELTCLLDSI